MVCKYYQICPLYRLVQSVGAECNPDRCGLFRVYEEAFRQVIGRALLKHAGD